MALVSVPDFSRPFDAPKSHSRSHNVPHDAYVVTRCREDDEWNAATRHGIGAFEFAPEELARRWRFRSKDKDNCWQGFQHVSALSTEMRNQPPVQRGSQHSSSSSSSHIPCRPACIAPRRPEVTALKFLLRANLENSRDRTDPPQVVREHRNPKP